MTTITKTEEVPFLKLNVEEEEEEEEFDEVTFFDILKKNSVELFDPSAKETLLQDLGIAVKPISRDAQELYRNHSLFPTTVYYYENNEKNRDFLGLNYPDLKHVTPNKLLSCRAILQCSNNYVDSLSNENYNEEKIKEQDSKPLVLGSNIFAEKPEDIKLNNSKSILNVALHNLSKENKEIKRYLQEKAAENRGFKGGDRTAFLEKMNMIKNINKTNNEYIANNNLHSFYWFANHKFENNVLKVKQFLNKYMFDAHYGFSSVRRRGTIKLVSNQERDCGDENCMYNISLISDLSTVIPSDDASTQMFATSFGRLAYETVSSVHGSYSASALFLYYFGDFFIRPGPSNTINLTDSKISWRQLNSRDQPTVFFSNIDLVHLLYCIFFKLLLSIDRDSFFELISNLTTLNNDDITKMNINREEINNNQLFSEENIPHFVIKEVLYNNGENPPELEIKNVVNNLGTQMFISTTLQPYEDGDFYTGPVKYDNEANWNIVLSSMFFYFKKNILNANADEINPYDENEISTRFKGYDTVKSNNNNETITNNNLSSFNDKIIQYSYIPGFPPIVFTPLPHNGISSRKSGYGKIEDGNKRELVFENNNTFLLNVDETSNRERLELTDIYIKNQNFVWGFEKSRIEDDMNKMLSYLCQLVYFPTDVVIKVSNIMFGSLSENLSSVNRDPREITKSYIVYIGEFDEDPSFPHAFNPRSETPSPSYHRIHVWLYINNKSENLNSENKDRYVKLLIINRGSRTALDWEDIDKCIIDGTGIFNKRAIEYSKIVYEILNKFDNMLGNIKKLVKVAKSATYLNEFKKFRRIKIISSGHSLGGFLAFYFSYMSLTRNIIQFYKGSNITGKLPTSFVTESKWIIDNYIIPVGFQPFIIGAAVKNFLDLPYGVVLSVHGNENENKLYRDSYTDIASPVLMLEISKKQVEGRNNIELITYQNVFIKPIIDSLLKKSGLTSYALIRKIPGDAHGLFQMTGIAFRYLAEKTKSDSFIINSLRNININLESTKNQIDLPENYNGFIDNSDSDNDILIFNSEDPDNVSLSDNYLTQATRIVKESVDGFLNAQVNGGGVPPKTKRRRTNKKKNTRKRKSFRNKK